MAHEKCDERCPHGDEAGTRRCHCKCEDCWNIACKCEFCKLLQQARED